MAFLQPLHHCVLRQFELFVFFVPQSLRFSRKVDQFLVIDPFHFRDLHGLGVYLILYSPIA